MTINAFKTFGIILLLGAVTANAATFTVNSTGDGADAAVGDGVCADAAGACTLRAAIQESNSTAALDTVEFAIAGSGVHTFTPASAYPNITQAIVIDGRTQGGPGYTGPPLLELDGTAAGTGVNGFNITGGTGTTIRHLIINRFPMSGVNILNSGNNVITGCYIGTNFDGTLDFGNLQFGIRMQNSGNNQIGGSAAGEGNLISGNNFEGIFFIGLSETGNVVHGNFIGTNAAGNAAIPNNDDGIEFTVGANGNTIGGPSPGQGNLISGNIGVGVNIVSGTLNTIVGNFIGTDVSGTLDLGNTNAGVNITTNSGGNIIGGIGSGEGNLIAYNLRGVVVTGTALNNSIRGNSITSNDLLGIELTPFGATPNDAGDADAGPNNLQNFPVIASAVSSSTSTGITGTFNGAANSTFQLDFYSAAAADTSLHGEGEVYLGSTTVATDASGDATFSVLFTIPTQIGHFVTATATDSLGNTSEFALSAAVVAPTAAAVTATGVVIDQKGHPVAAAIVSVTAPDGSVQTAVSNPFGNFAFTGLPAGTIYIFSVSKKGTTFSEPRRVITLHEDTSGIIFVGDPL